MTGTSFAHGALKSIVERIERLEEDKAEIAEEIKGVYSEAKADGFDTKVLKKIIALRKLSKDQRDEEMSMIDVYMAALGMLPSEDGEEEAE